MPDTDPGFFVQAQTRIGTAALVPEIQLHLAHAVTPLWEATEATMAANNLPPPYWAFAWPGGQVLARFILDRPDWVQGKTVLDFAAGCGIGAIAAAKAGAAASTAAEIDRFAAAAIALNAAANAVSVSVTLDDVLAKPAHGYGLILAGDVCYERPMAERTIAWLRAAARNGAEILLSDPGRAYLPKAGLEELARYAVPTSLDIENRTMMDTVVYRLI